MITLIASVVSESVWFVGKKTIGAIWGYFRPSTEITRTEHLEEEIKKLEDKIDELRKEHQLEKV